MNEDQNREETMNVSQNENVVTPEDAEKSTEQQAVNEQSATTSTDENQSTTETAAEPTEEKQEDSSADSKPVAETETAAEAAPKTTHKIAPLEDFDWDAYEQGDTYSKSERNKLAAMYDDTLTAINDQDVVDGIVTSMNKREAVINIGFKSEGVVSMNEFKYNPDLKVGDTVEVYIENQEDKNGQLILSHKKARAMRAWDRVNAAHDNNEIITGYIKCRTKGGMIVDVFGIEAFLPGSQIDVKPIRDYDLFVGKTMEFKVVKINPEYKNVVVSHKALIEEELELQRQEIISKLEKGQVLEGTVKNITPYGAFVDLGGVDGLVHITDLSWSRVQHPSDVVSLDQKINVVILDFQKEKKRIALGIKQLQPHPWDSLGDKYKAGDIVRGKVVVVTDYGAFVEIEPGIEGLVHVSEMSWTQHLHSAQDFINVGEEVDVMILGIDRDERKISLGIKQLKPDPWENIETRYPIGSRHTAKVRRFTNFGAFAEMEEGVGGLIHISDLSWTKKIKHPSEVTEIGADIDVVVLDIDKENRRLSLGHKQLEENPWDVFETIFTVDSVHEGTVTEQIDKGYLISLPYGVEAFATPKHMVKEDGKQAQVDDKLDFKVIEFNKDAKRIIVSHSRVYEDKAQEARDAEKREVDKALKNSGPVEVTTLGDIEELAALKEKLDNRKVEAFLKREEEKQEAKEAKEVSEPSETSEKKKSEPEETAETKKENSTEAEKTAKTKRENSTEAEETAKAKRENSTEAEETAETKKENSTEAEENPNKENKSEENPKTPEEEKNGETETKAEAKPEEVSEKALEEEEAKPEDNGNEIKGEEESPKTEDKAGEAPKEEKADTDSETNSEK